MPNKVNFGFKEVDFDQKKNLVGGVFSSVASKYDLMNDVMSAGLHRLWKNKMINEIDFYHSDQNYKFIDVAGGTGDIAFKILEKARKINTSCEIDLVDINQEMLNVGKTRAIDKNYFSSLNFTCADGENLPFADNSFDYFTIAFGIRNFTDIQKGISEAHRVLKNGGKFICLEFSKVNDYFLQKIYDLYSFKFIPKMGELILNDRESYQYLVESIRKFPNPEDFKKMIEKAGFKDASFKTMNFGVVAMHIGYKNEEK